MSQQDTEILDAVRKTYSHDHNVVTVIEIAERTRVGLDAAVRAANLALFVIHKQGVMPNDSWESGFKKDMATAEAALGRS